MVDNHLRRQDADGRKLVSRTSAYSSERQLDIGHIPILLLMEKQCEEMKPTGKRFWIFEAFTVLYAIGLMLLGYGVWGKSSVVEFQLSVVGLCCISGLATWPIAKGRHWLVFGFIYEAVFLLIISVCLWIDAMINHATVFNDLLLDISIFLYFIFVIAVVTFLPSLALAFFGYHLFDKNVGDKKKTEAERQSDETDG